MRVKKKSRSNKVDVYTKKSPLRGFAGVLETFFRNYNDLFHILLVIPLYMMGSVLIGLGFVPGVWIFGHVYDFTAGWATEGAQFWMFARYLALGSAIAASYFSYGFTMVFVIPVFNWMVGGKLKPWRGPYYSLASIRWYIHNGVVYLLRYTFLELITPTPVSVLFYKMMGMKIGRGSVINSTAISDPSLITLGEKVTIGGSVTLTGHYGQGGFLVLAPVIIEDRVTIGLRATVMGGAHIGREAKVLPHSVVMPKTVIPAGETWGGVPARKIDVEKLKREIEAGKSAA